MNHHDGKLFSFSQLLSKRQAQQQHQLASGLSAEWSFLEDGWIPPLFWISGPSLHDGALSPRSVPGGSWETESQARPRQPSLWSSGHRRCSSRLHAATSNLHILPVPPAAASLSRRPIISQQSQFKCALFQPRGWIVLKAETRLGKWMPADEIWQRWQLRTQQNLVYQILQARISQSSIPDKGATLQPWALGLWMQTKQKGCSWRSLLCVRQQKTPLHRKLNFSELWQ